MKTLQLFKDKKILAWALYDWANSAFATTIMAGFFPLFFKNYWSHGVDPTVSTYYLGVTNSLASALIALAAPFLGVLADLGRRKKQLLAIFASLGALASLGLCFVGQGQWSTAALLYALGCIGFSASNIFYDSLIVDVSTPDNVDQVSGLGYSLGYLGGGFLFVINVFMYLKPELFGLKTGVQGVLVSFFSVGVWWTLFSTPIFLYVEETSQSFNNSLTFEKGLSELKKTAREIWNSRTLFYFLLGFMLYNDGVNTIIKMAVDYGLALGFPSDSLIKALLITQFVGFPSAIFFGFLGQRFSPKLGIFICLLVYIVVTLLGYSMSQVHEFYLLATIIGLVQGGVQALSRSQFTRLIPAQRSTEFFGFYNMLGKFSAILGPICVGAVAQYSGNSRLSLLVILLFFFIGGYFFWQHDRSPSTQSDS